MNPQFLLREVLKNERTITFSETVREKDTIYDVLIISDDVSPIKLYINNKNGTISKLETKTNHMILRDIVLRATYKNWKKAESVRFPMQVDIAVSGNKLLHQLHESVVENPELEEGYFAFPKKVDGLTKDSTAYNKGLRTHHIHDEFFEIAGLYYIEEVSLEATKLASGIYEVRDNSSNHLGGMIVEYEKGVVVIEAHTSEDVSKELLKIVQKNFPDKAITHLIQSHHHVDHASGVRAVVSLGSELIIGKGTGDWWENVLKAESTIRPDEMSSSSVSPTVTEVDYNDKWTLSDGNVYITVYHVSDNPHASDMLITKVEKDNQIFLYEADLYNAGFGFTMAYGGPESLFKALRKFELIDSDCKSQQPFTIIPGHGKPVTIGQAISELGQLGIAIDCGTE